LADDAGAGKTIMAGLYIREMKSRRLIKRILIVPPAGLIGRITQTAREAIAGRSCIGSGQAGTA
jgi:SNF2 family DNA or RNA helicase